MKPNDKIIEEFREQFRPEYAGGGSIKNIVAYGKKLKSVKVDLSEVEQFILKALEQKEREIVEKIKSAKRINRGVGFDLYDIQVNEALDDIIKLIKTT